MASAITIILLLTFILLIALFPLSLSLAFFFGAPFVASPRKIINEMIKLSEISSKDIVYDLGSGDGRVLLECVKICKKAVGYEINLFLVIWTKIILLLTDNRSKVEVKWQNYNKSQLNQATVVFLYVLPGFLPNLQKKLKKELQQGTKIVSYKFKLSGFKLVKKTKSGIYLYIVE